MREYYSSMHIVEDEWFPNQTMCYVNLALANFRLGSQHAQEMFVEAIKKGVDNVYTYQTRKIECETIPQLVKEHKLVIISGAPGVGKSTLARKVCQDVCRSPSCYGYSLVLLVELRKLLLFTKDFKLVDILKLFQGMIGDTTSLHQSQKIVFDSSNLQGLGERFSDHKRGCGVLTARPIQCGPKSRKGAIESFFFIHLTVQEFLAAVYVSLRSAHWQCKVWARYLGEPHMAQVWCFYCGLTKLQHFDHLQGRINSYPKDFQMQCLYETQDISLVRRLMPHIVGEEVNMRPETAYDSTAYGYCLSVLPSLKRLTIEKSAGSAEIHRLLWPVYASGTLQTLHQTAKGEV